MGILLAVLFGDGYGQIPDDYRIPQGHVLMQLIRSRRKEFYHNPPGRIALRLVAPVVLKLDASRSFVLMQT